MQSLKLGFQPRVPNSSTPSFQNFKQLFITPIIDDDCHLLPPFIDNVMVAYILPCLPMTMSRLWHFRRVNKGWCEAVGETIAWNGLELGKINKQAFQKFIAMYGLKRHSLHEQLQIEIDYLQDFLEWYATFESFENVESDANTIFSSS
jgi:hypothetical protein